MLINIMDLLDAEVDKEIAKKKAAQNATGCAETAKDSLAATALPDNSKAAPEPNGGAS